jgi:heavy metal translocating P-type ATPase
VGPSAFKDSAGQLYCCYGCGVVEGLLRSREEGDRIDPVLARLGVGALLSMTVMMLSLVLYVSPAQSIPPTLRAAFGWALLAFSAPAVALLSAPYLRAGVSGVRNGRAGSDALVALGSLSAFGVSAWHVLRGSGPIYFDTATMLLVLVTAGRLIEASAKSGTSRLVRGLLNLAPQTAHRLDGTEERDLPAADLMPGDAVAVWPGERVPADGAIVSGSSSVEESAFTGESRPRPCGPGHRVHAGSVNLEGRLVLRVEQAGHGSLLAQMARLVEDAEARRAPSQRLADRAAAGLLALVWATALGAFLYWALAAGDATRAGSAALSVLVVACPCAFGLATPLAVSVSISRAAQAGVLIRSGDALERMARLKRLYLDKTGTLTRSQLSLQAMESTDRSVSEAEALSWAATLEGATRHPAGLALRTAAKQRGCPEGTVEDAHAEPGGGVVGTVALDGVRREVAVGSLPFLASRGMGLPPDADPASATSDCGVGWNGRVRALFYLADTPRPEAAEVVTSLGRLGLEVSLLSGDNESAAQTVALQVGITQVHAACSPTDKVSIVRAASGTHGGLTGMAGDGLNDAPALASTDLGIALASGTDLAREAGDVVLLGDDLRRLPWSIALARRTTRVIRQNLLWACGYNTLALAAAAHGSLHPLAAALLMLLSSLFVLGNSLRLLSHSGP